MMAMKTAIGAASVLAASALLLAGCDRSQQSADGATGAGQVGTAATGNGEVASTGSPEQGGGGGTPTAKGVSGGMTTDANGNPPAAETPMGSVHAKGP